MTTTTIHTQDQQPAAPDQPTRIFAQWGLLHTVTPRFGARLIQEHHRLHFLSDRASLIGEQHSGFTCEAATLSSHGYVYLAIYPLASMDACHGCKA